MRDERIQHCNSYIPFQRRSSSRTLYTCLWQPSDDGNHVCLHDSKKSSCFETWLFLIVQNYSEVNNLMTITGFPIYGKPRSAQGRSSSGLPSPVLIFKLLPTTLHHEFLFVKSMMCFICWISSRCYSGKSSIRHMLLWLLSTLSRPVCICQDKYSFVYVFGFFCFYSYLALRNDLAEVHLISDEGYSGYLA